jgi:glycosyltransferase, group 2 family protein
MLLDFAKKGMKIKEYPIETIYINDNEESHFDTVKDSVRIYSQIIKFCGSSLLSFIVDFLVYSIGLLISGNILFSNAFARIISLHFNFFINKRFVFEEGEKSRLRGKEYLKYLGLAAFIFVMNTLILRGIVETFRINAYIAKILTEVILFTLSYLVQKKLVFSKVQQKPERLFNI